MAVLLIAAYFALAQRLGLLYPVSPFQMFQEAMTIEQRIIVRTADGRIADVDAFTDWETQSAVDFDHGPVRDCRSLSSDGQDAIAAEYIRSHSGHAASSQPVTVSRRIFRIIDPLAAPVVTDCTILDRCRARRITQL